MKKLIIICIILLIGGLGLFWGYDWYQNKVETQRQTTEPSLTPAQKRNLEETIHYTGEISPLNSTEIRSEISGRITKLYVYSGQQIKANDPLVELNQREIKSRIKAATHRIESSRLKAEKSKMDFQRKKNLFARELISKKDFDDAKIDYSLAQNELDIQKAQLETLEEELTKTKIIAPHEGVVLDLKAQEEMVITAANSVNQGTTLLKIANLSKLLVETKINEIDISKIKNEMSVKISFDSVPDFTTEGKVVFISPSASEKTDRNKIRTFSTRVVFNAQDKRIRPGMSAQLQFITQTAENAISVPISAVFTEEKESFVYCKKQDGFKRQIVKTGITDLKHIEIKSGLTEGDHVALDRPSDFKESNSSQKKKENEKE